MPEKYIYVFVRQDISLPQQLVQSNHASILLSQTHKIEGTPNLILIGVRDICELENVRYRLLGSGYDFVMWSEPDYDMGETAIATVPLDQSQRMIFSQYRLWVPLSPCSLSAERPAA